MQFASRKQTPNGGPDYCIDEIHKHTGKGERTADQTTGQTTKACCDKCGHGSRDNTGHNDRSRTRIQYFEEKASNPYLEQKFSLFQSFKERAAVAYEVLWRRESREDSVFNRDEITVSPRNDYEKVVLRLRYRRNFWRPWMFIELWPSIGWAEERDWDRVLGARVRFEVNFGRHKGLKLGE